MAKTDNEKLRAEGKLVPDDYERLPKEPDTDEDEDVMNAIANPNDPTIRSDGFAYAPEEEIGLQMDRVEILGPPAYGSPDVATTASRLVPLRDHPLNAERLPEGHPAAISEDYGQELREAKGEFGREGTHPGPPSQTDVERDAGGRPEEGYEAMTVAELKDMARDRDIEGFSSMNKKELIKAHEKYDESAGQPDNND